MATKIRLKRIGRRNRPFYRLIVIDSRKQRDGAAIEEVGWYNPIDEDHSYDLKGDRILHWLSQGAVPTNAAHKLMRRAGIAHRWHLIQQGMDEAEIDKEMKKWELNREDVLKVRAVKKETKEVKRDKEKVSADAKAGDGLKSKEDSEAPKVEEKTESISPVDENEESIEKLKDGDKASQDNVEESVASSGNNSDEENIAVEESVPEDAIDVGEDNSSEEE
ncbi:MAG: 30S ribosomal protein S16 [Candidatus Marinimicrobia bacterium]|nr:30S ribosomal protein S16 [Candidatus Neomarinimicrobiota bacterium]